MSYVRGLFTSLKTNCPNRICSAGYMLTDLCLSHSTWKISSGTSSSTSSSSFLECWTSRQWRRWSCGVCGSLPWSFSTLWCSSAKTDLNMWVMCVFRLFSAFYYSKAGVSLTYRYFQIVQDNTSDWLNYWQYFLECLLKLHLGKATVKMCCASHTSWQPGCNRKNPHFFNRFQWK